MGSAFLLLLLILAVLYIIRLIRKQYKDSDPELMNKYIFITIVIALSAILTFILDPIIEIFN